MRAPVQHRAYLTVLQPYEPDLSAFDFAEQELTNWQFIDKAYVDATHSAVAVNLAGTFGERCRQRSWPAHPRTIYPVPAPASRYPSGDSRC